MTRVSYALSALLAPLLMGLGAAWPAMATTSVTLSPISGHPGLTVNVSGSGFGPNEAVDIYFDTTDMVLDVVNDSGAFGPSKLKVPASAEPGAHWITAVGRRDGDAGHKSFTVRTAWAELGFSPHGKRNNPYENVITAGNAAALDLAWVARTGNQVLSAPAVVNGVVYIGSFDTKLHAYDAITGAVKWTAATGAGIETSSPAVVNGVVYIASDDHNVYAFNASTGALKWAAPTGSDILSSPAVVNGVVYIGSYDKKVYAFDAATGAVKWSVATGAAVSSSPAVANGIVYVGSSDGSLYALNATTGALLWAAPTGGPIESSSPAVANGVVYIGSDDFKLYAFNASTGAVLWTAPTGSFVPSSPAVANGVVYVGSQDDKVYAFDAGTGATLWSATTGDQVYASPTVSDGMVYVGSLDHKLYAFALNGGSNAVYRRSATPPPYDSLHPDHRLKPAR